MYKVIRKRMLTAQNLEGYMNSLYADGYNLVHSDEDYVYMFKRPEPTAKAKDYF